MKVLKLFHCSECHHIHESMVAEGEVESVCNVCGCMAKLIVVSHGYMGIDVKW